MGMRKQVKDCQFGELNGGIYAALLLGIRKIIRRLFEAEN